METIKEFFKSIFQSSTERFNSPIVGTYFIYFLIYNWQAFFVILFSNSSIEERIARINELYSDSEAIIIPAIITLLYIVVLPHLQLLIDYVLSFSQNIAYNITQHRLKRSLTGKIEEAALEREIADSRAGTSEINNLKLQVDLLKGQNEDLLKKSNNDLQNYNNQVTELNNQQSETTILINNLRKEVKRYKDLYDTLYNNPNMVLLPNESIDIINNFSNGEQLEFIKVSNENFKNEMEHKELLSRALQLGVIYKNKSGEITLTQFGKIVLKYFNQTVLPF